MDEKNKVGGRILHPTERGFVVHFGFFHPLCKQPLLLEDQGCVRNMYTPYQRKKGMVQIQSSSNKEMEFSLRIFLIIDASRVPMCLLKFIEMLVEINETFSEHFRGSTLTNVLCREYASCKYFNFFERMMEKCQANSWNFLL